jgi:hypothetical protein
MKFIDTLSLFVESVKNGKLLVKQGKLSQQELENIISADPTTQKKYVGWMAKQWALKQVTDIDVLRNTIEEWNVFANRDLTKNKDVYNYKTFSELKDEVDQINQSGQSVSSKELEEDYESIRNDDDLLIMSPHTHEASRKIGLAYFAFRDCPAGGKDSAWCTTYKVPDHFNDYYYSQNITFYYIRVKSQRLQEALKSANYDETHYVVAIAVRGDGEPMEAYSATDKKFQGPLLEKYLSIIGIA